MKSGDLVRFRVAPDSLGMVLGPEYVPLKGKRYTNYQLQMLLVLRVGGRNPSQVIRVHRSYLEVVE